MYLTKRQLQILDYLRTYIERHRIAPTLEEIAGHFGLSRVTVHEHLRALERKGAIERSPRRTRSLRILDPAPPQRLPALPVLGRVQAGAPTVPFEEPELLSLEQWFPDLENLFLLRVAGDSMIGDHITEDDLIVVDRSREPRSGDIVVASTPDGEVTLKRLYLESDHVRLEPSNDRLPPIRVDTARVHGVVVGLLRRF